MKKDITELLVSYLQTMSQSDDVHFGEMIPQGVGYPFVWLMRSGEEYAEDLCHPPTIEMIRVDVEVVSDDINEARYWTSRVKRHLHSAGLNTLKFWNDSDLQQYIHAIDVDDHDDDYLVRSVGSEDPLHVGALDVMINLGALV